MIRQWQELFFDQRLSGCELDGNPDFVKLGESYGVKGFRIRRAGDVTKILKKALAYNDGPCIIHAEVVKEDNVFPMIPAGAAVKDMLIEKPKDRKLEKPVGSTWEAFEYKPYAYWNYVRDWNFQIERSLSF